MHTLQIKSCLLDCSLFTFPASDRVKQERNNKNLLPVLFLSLEFRYFFRNLWKKCLPCKILQTILIYSTLVFYLILSHILFKFRWAAAWDKIFIGEAPVYNKKTLWGPHVIGPATTFLGVPPYILPHILYIQHTIHVYSWGQSETWVMRALFYFQKLKVCRNFPFIDSLGPVHTLVLQYELTWK